MNSGNEYKLTDICVAVGLKKSRTRAIISDLIDMGRIEKLGNNRDRRYKLISK